ncbi:unnamed protein product [Linum trigynum]|uniref:RNA methyltransferase n=1 Tax=Linum trigynum TaxID=586398 RepID=A0AAV2GYG8_9ROSI
MAEAEGENREEIVVEKKSKRNRKKQKTENPSQKEETQERKQNGEGKPQQQNQVAGGDHPAQNNNGGSSSSKKRKQREAFPFGNYRNYYGYRIGQELDEDPRLKVLKREWFEGKDCLDIGCNSGIITIHIAKKYNCRSILGVDIDTARISDAYWHLRKFSREHSGSSSTNVSKEEVKEKLKASKQIAHVVPGDDEEIKKEASFSEKRNLFDVVSFRQENFVDSRHSHEKQYDTILCLSVAKWIHLNWGDDGLITLFSKVWKLLVPGGTFILEPQPWDSYKKNYQVSKTAAENYRNIMFPPESFREILLDKIGFRSVEDLTAGLTGSKTGFNRPIFAFHK